MGIKQVVQRLRTPTEELDRSKRATRRADLGATPTDAVIDRQLVELVGEVRSMRIVPRAGTSTLELVIDDGHGLATAVFYGRRAIAGLHAGRAVKVSGRASLRTGRPSLINPAYELLD